MNGASDPDITPQTGSKKVCIIVFLALVHCLVFSVRDEKKKKKIFSRIHTLNMNCLK